MKNLKSKTIATAISLILLLTITATLLVAPVQAHDPPWTIEAWVYAGVTPRTIGVNQQGLIVFWCNWVPPTVGVDSRYGDRWIFNVDITAPDGTTKTQGPYKSDPVGGAYALFTPTQVGTYKIVVQMPAYKVTGLPSATGTPVNSPYVGDTYGPATSEPVYLKVQQEQIQPWQETPEPTRYWTRPINTANRNWDILAGNWLGGAGQAISPGFSGYASGMFAFEPYARGPGPESAHIMWTKPYWAGGIMDQFFGDTGYETAHYQGINLGNPIIIQGKIILPWRNTAHTTTSWWALDLYTGETISFENTTTIPAFGQIYNYESPNQHGGFPYLWRTSGVTLPAGDKSKPGTQTWELLDGYTLQSITKIANVSAGGTAVYGKDGSILRYNIVNLGNAANPNYYLQVWNSSATPTLLQGTSGTNFWQWRPARSAVHNGENGFSLNASIPAVQGGILAVREDLYVIGGVAGKNNGTYIEKGHLWALNLDRNKGAMGSLLWNISFTPPLSTSDIVAGSGLTSYGVSFGPVDPEDGVFLFEHRLTLKRWGYSLTTGLQIWGPTPAEESFNFYGMNENIYKGKLITMGYSGQIRAYDIKTGDILWTYNSTTVGFESPYAGLYPTGVAVIADDKLYCVSSEHSPTQPLWRGPNLRCLDANTGEEIFKVLFWGGRMSPTEPNLYLADGHLVGLNYYDMRLYCFGKGPSAITAEAPMNAITLGEQLVIRGTVTDEAVGAKEIASNTGFKNGVPAVSDESMSDWMEYIYMQQPKPTDTTGVPVYITATDPNGNIQEIGTATSDDLGNYAIDWTPPIEGLYKVRAVFDGSESFFGSEASTSFVVSKAAAKASSEPTQTSVPTQTAAPTTPTPPVQTASPSPSPNVIPPTSATPTATYIAIGAAVIVIVAAAAAIILRKRK